MKKIIICLAILVMVFFTGCGLTDGEGQTDISKKEINLDEVDNDLTIRSGGIYYLTGTLNGTVFIDAGSRKDVEIVLNGATIHGGNYAAIYVKKCNSFKLTLAEGTANYLDDNEEYTMIDDKNVSACVYSRYDMILDGTGNLTINTHQDAIKTKDYLTVNGGTYDINAAWKGLIGRDGVVINDGNVNITSKKDGVCTTNIDTPDVGRICINGGDINITSYSDGIYAVGNIDISGGNFEITTLKNNAGKSNKGIKSDKDINIGGGKFNLNCFDDCINADGNVVISDGKMKMQSEDDAIHAEYDLTFSGGNLSVSLCDEGLQGQNVIVSGGKLNISAQDDGINAIDPRDKSSDWGGNDPSTDASILIQGGEIKIKAKGDGLDSNGFIRIEDGETVIDGPKDDSDAAFDYATSGEICGGTILAIGDAGQAEPPTEGSTQKSFIIDLGRTYSSKSDISIYAGGKQIFKHTSAKKFSCVLFSSPELEKADSVELIINGEARTINLNSKVKNLL